jgi:hypothetical protein
MRHAKLALAILVTAAAYAWSCQSKTADARPADETGTKTAASREELVSRGRFLVEIGGCNDCHTPKIMGPQGPALDTTKLLSGRPAAMPMPPIAASALQPGNWVLMSPDVTTFVGPWGISYAANLTSDSATGIGAWTEEQFIKTMRTGKHLGLEGGRPILPPMPWQGLGKLPDEELKAMFAYLQSVPAVSNRVPGPVSPDKVVVAK